MPGPPEERGLEPRMSGITALTALKPEVFGGDDGFEPIGVYASGTR